jgi:hypothetical protein
VFSVGAHFKKEHVRANGPAQGGQQSFAPDFWAS